MVGLQTLDLAIGVRVPASQPTSQSSGVRQNSKSLWRQIDLIHSVDYFLDFGEIVAE